MSSHKSGKKLNRMIFSIPEFSEPRPSVTTLPPSAKYVTQRDISVSLMQDLKETQDCDGTGQHCTAILKNKTLISADYNIRIRISLNRQMDILSLL